MLVKILGTVDIISGTILILFMNRLPVEAFMILGVIFLAKSTLGMLKDFASWIDVITGLIFIISILCQVPQIITIILGAFIVQKGIISFI